MLSHWLQNPRIFNFFRALSIVAGAVFLVLTVAFYTRSELARALWPWPETTLSPLSYTFIASITIAIALPLLRIGVTGELAATFGGAINLSITFIGAAIFMLQSYADNQRGEVLTGVIVCGLLALSALFSCLLTWSVPFKDTLPMPRLVRRTFVFLGVVLIVVGSGLVLKQQMFPWPLSTEAGVIYGWIFLGASTYFWYGVYRPVWGNASGQYIGFLAYDLILLVPFLRHLGNVQPAHRLSLYLYLAVIVFTTIQAVYYLFIAPQTRLWRRQRSEGVSSYV